ncbi:hypothetical protein [Nocardia brasiliensis]|nr:hypothetical protein [Nocardia brasiliensis]
MSARILFTGSRRWTDYAAIPLTIATGDQPAVPVPPERRGI